MLSSDVPVTPRPRPPAKVRRSSSLHEAGSLQKTWQANDQNPPPYESPTPSGSSFSYQPSLPTLLGSPIHATSQLMGLEEDGIGPTSPDIHDWVKERSREELTELLLKARTLVKEREEELEMTSVARKSLAENNNKLKSKNDALIARISSDSRPQSPSSTFHRPSPSHSRSSSLKSPPVWSPDTPTPPPKKRTHARTTSYSPAALAALADQNCELLTKLQDLEADAARADAAGKKRLKALEREIELLKDELDKTREASERLEEKMQNPSSLGPPAGLDDELTRLWKKLNREAKVRELRAKTRPWEDKKQDDVPRDFAPSSNAFTPRRALTLRGVPGDDLFFPPTSQDDRKSETSTSSVVMSPSVSASTSTSSFSGDTHERMVVTQLLLKIRELEETNASLVAQHVESRLKLQRAESDVQNVRRLCDIITDEVSAGLEFEMVVEDTDDLDQASSSKDSLSEMTPRKTIRLRSIGRKSSLNLDTFRNVDHPSSSHLSSNSRGFLESSQRSLRRHASHSDINLAHRMDTLQPKAIGRAHRKSRKSVRGLFGEDDGELSSPSSSGEPTTPSSTMDPEKRPSSGDPFFQPKVSRTNSEMSTVSSLIDIGEPDNVRPSLGIELQSELEKAGGLRPSDSFSHMRTNSIMDLLRSAEGAEEANSSKIDGGRPQTTNRSLRASKMRRSQSSIALRRKYSRPSLPANNSDALVNRDSPTPTRDLSLLETRSKNPVVRLLVELWLWLQFAIIVGVFVFTMAKAGPTGLHKRPAHKRKQSTR